MDKSTERFRVIINQLALEAVAQRLTQTEWAARAGVRKETVSRLHRRQSCDFATLQALAEVVGASLTITKDGSTDCTADGQFPARVDRDYEEALLGLCSSGDFTLERWKSFGPRFFMAGLAVMIASVPGMDRRALLDLAEQLHAGSSHDGVFALWLKRSPVRPSRFLPMLAMQRHAA